MKNKHIYPAWAIAHRKPGTELRYINKTYYLYEVSSFYDPLLKRGKKKTGPLLGKITELGGFIASHKKTLSDKVSFSSKASFEIGSIYIRECGFTKFLHQYGSDIEVKLKKVFPEDYKYIIYMAYCRIVHNSPINRMPLHIAKSMISINEKQVINPKKLSDVLTRIGLDRGKCVQYMNSCMKTESESTMLVDMTNMFSNSGKIHYVKEGYNSEMVFDTQVNLMYIYSATSNQPIFYKLLNGNTKEVTGFKNCLVESGIKNAIIIADKGFNSKSNIELLKQHQLKYIIPLKRDSHLIDYSKLDQTTNEYFKFEDRMIWYTNFEAEGHTIHLFKDDRLKTQESKDYLQRIDSKYEGYTREKYNQKQMAFGTFALISNLEDHTPHQTYAKYKSRNAIEVMFDGIKTILKADTTYMQKTETLNGWMFVNHIAIQFYYIIYTMLAEHNLLSKISVKQFITELAEHRQVKINDEWVEEAMIKSTKAMLEKLKIYSVNPIKS